MKLNIKIKTACFVALTGTIFPAGICGQRVDSTLVSTATAISVISADDIARNAVNTLEESLNGTLSGLYTLKQGGQKFGARNYEFFIRGKATTADATPLILVDGVEANINLLNFNEVESVSILKDAPALAIYGMRGANGVILIATKRGADGKNVVGLDIRTGMQAPVGWGKSLNAYDYTSMYNEALINDGGAGIYRPDVYLDNNRDSYIYPDNRLGDQFLRNHSFVQQYDFTARGGNQTAQYFCLAGYSKQGGLFALPDDAGGFNQKSYERYNFRSNVDVDLGAGFDMSVDVAAAFDYNRSPWMNTEGDANALSDALVNLILNTPANAFPLWNRDGSLGGTSVYSNNPQGVLQRGGLRTDEHKLLSARVKFSKDLAFITPGLKAHIMYHFENYNASYKSKYKKFAVYQYNPLTDTYAGYGSDDTKTTIDGGQTSDNYRHNNIAVGLEYRRSFGKHSIDGSFILDRTQKSVSGDVPDYKYQGLAARAIYGYMGRYYADLSAAVQGSNSYVQGERYGFFPAIGLSWILSNEKFLQDNPAVDFLKLRLSTGLNGNDRTAGNRFAYRQSWYAGSGYGFGNPNAASDGSYEGALANPDATWEKSFKTNLGADFTTLQGRLSLTVDLFSERRTRIMTEQANRTSSMIGIGLPYVNGGTVTNKGIEASLEYNRQVGAVGLLLGGNFLFARNKIVDLYEPAYEYGWMYKKGNAINTIYGLVADGIYRRPEDVVGAPASVYGTLTPGDIRYVNQNPADDQVINQLDIVPIGNTFPEMIYGIHVGVTYKDFDFTCFGKGAALNDIYQKPEQLSVYARDNRWQHAGSNMQYPKLSMSDTHNTQTSTFWLQSGDYFRINSLELGYTLPQRILKKSFISGLRIYLNANNVFTFNGEREKRDPEAPLAGFTEYPLLRTYIIGLSVKL